ncbi:2-(3-amino-3-carboxypropyl)histidine synthase protein [Dioscorea alata]|uniref:2-(3-amino-3-carboxypropyl)histidine synthase protein n=1 Tax=Dioscorea alata TaxID=55571 RepID=A0ACB7V8F9_DIOAL|nr:2-(3-amino-3-carboxypropyl)histidine synthase protein [Dioscorea alata]
MDPDESSAALLAAPFPNPNPSPKKKPLPKRFVKSQIPDFLLSNPALNTAIAVLPRNYEFEIHKTLHRITTSSARRVVLQLPDGLLMYSLAIADIIRTFSPHPVDVSVLGDPTYGACCVDDLAASALSADLLVHYGHSCLVPVTTSRVPALYVFVDIRIDVSRLVSAVKSTFPPSSRLALAGTVQFISAVHAARSVLSDDGYDITVPQAKPLSAGEVLGCTSPTIPKSKGIESVVFVADGRFHLEAFMIANPGIKAFRYDPFLGVLVLEKYDHEGMKEARKASILEARKAKNWGVILGTLGRQGNTKVLDRVTGMMDERDIDYTVVMMSEISPARIALFADSVDAWVQIACPRLSIDWGEGFKKPLLTTFEFEIALGLIPGWWERRRTAELRTSDCNETVRKECCSGSGGCGSVSCGNDCDEATDYPMDYYAQDGGEWNSAYSKKKASNGAMRRHGGVALGSRDTKIEVNQ